MRIAFILTQDLESPSGLGRYWPLGKELRQLGHDVTILALHSDYAALTPQERDEMREGVRVRYVGQMHVRKTGSRKTYFGPSRLLYNSLLSTFRLARSALYAHPDVYHVGKPHPMNGLAGLLASRLRDTPLYVDCDDYEAISNRFGGNWQRWIVSLFERILPRLSDGITVNTSFMLEKLLEFGVSREVIERVPNGFDYGRFASVSESEVDRLRCRFSLEGKRSILYLGSMSLANHPVDLLLKAFEIVRGVEPLAVLLLVGGGEDYDSLRAQAKSLGLGESVLFVGRVPPRVAPVYYRLAEVSVDPVRNDPTAQARFPLKIVESLSVGVPVVTGDVGDRRAMLNDGETGVLVLPGCARSLAEGVLSILQDPCRRASMGYAALAYSDQWRWDHLVLDFAKVYD